MTDVELMALQGRLRLIGGEPCTTAADAIEALMAERDAVYRSWEQMCTEHTVADIRAECAESLLKEALFWVPNYSDLRKRIDAVFAQIAAREVNLRDGRK